MSQLASKYSIEIVDPSGIRLADLSGRARNRRLTKSRNEADEISWTLDLDEFEAYCRASNVEPASVLTTGRNEVRIKRGNTYLSGGQLTYWEVTRSAQEKTISLRAIGFFNLLSSRYTSEEFTATDGADIAWSLIENTQAEPHGDFGITRGSEVNVGLWNKTYARTSRKDAIQELAESPTRGFDFEFTHDKVFNQYSSIGSDRSKDIVFESPGNIIEYSVPNDATLLVNELIGIGSGNGDESQAVYVAADEASQLQHGLRQRFLNRSSTDNEDGSLEDAVNAELSAYAFPFEVPAITVDGNKAPYITDYGIGDIVRARLLDSDLVRHIDGSFRIERYTLIVDDNDDERVTVEFSV